MKPYVTYTQIVGAVLRHNRVKLGLEQKDLGPAVGVTRSQWSRIETGGSLANLVQIRKACRVLFTTQITFHQEVQTVIRHMKKAHPGILVIDEDPSDDSVWCLLARKSLKGIICAALELQP